MDYRRISLIASPCVECEGGSPKDNKGGSRRGSISNAESGDTMA